MIRFKIKILKKGKFKYRCPDKVESQVLIKTEQNLNNSILIQVLGFNLK